jgi:hypothetical protein
LSNIRKLLFSEEGMNTVKEFLTTHWYIGVAGGVLFIVIIVSTTYILLIYKYTNKPLFLCYKLILMLFVIYNTVCTVDFRHQINRN